MYSSSLNLYCPIFNVLQYALHPPAVIIEYQHRLIRNLTQLRLAILCITHSFHPLPDRDRSRIASGLLVRRLPPLSDELTSLRTGHTSQALPRQVLGGDGEIRTHGPYYYGRQVSNLLPSATRPRLLILAVPAGNDPAPHA